MVSDKNLRNVGTDRVSVLKRRPTRLNMFLLVILFLTIVIFSNALLSKHGTSAQDVITNTGAFAESSLPSQNTFVSSVDPTIASNEYTSPGNTFPIGNMFFSEAFAAGTATTSGTSGNLINGQCYYPTSYQTGHLALCPVCLVPGLNGCLASVSLLPCYKPPKLNGYATSQALYGMAGYPQFGEDFGSVSSNCQASAVTIFDSYLYSGFLELDGNTKACYGPLAGNGGTIAYNGIGTSLPGNRNAYGGTGTVYQYAGGPYYYGIVTLSPSMSSGSMIVPAVSCGSTFPFAPYAPEFSSGAAFGKSYDYLAFQSGFTPSVGLAANNNGAGDNVFYWYALSFWPIQAVGMFNKLATATNSFGSDFDFSYPTLNYAKFPNGNSGDSQYVNASDQFLTPINQTYFGSSDKNAVLPFASTDVILSYYVAPNFWANLVRLLLNQQLFVTLNDILNGTAVVSGYTVPNLQAFYYPGFGVPNPIDVSSLGFSVLLQHLGLHGQTLYDYSFEDFKIDGVYPVCALNAQTDTINPTCTFENTSNYPYPVSMNPTSYTRLWNYQAGGITGNSANSASVYFNRLDLQPFEPGYDSNSNLNPFTLKTLESFCFYGENFNLNTGYYTSPSYTRIIPPIGSENYDVAIGKCNAFFNNTDCFAQNSNDQATGQYLNFADGIFVSGLKCTQSGIQPVNVTDAWITSISVSNPAGDVCGLVGGRKNPTDPTANSMDFGPAQGTCPILNGNDSVVPLVITVKNVGNTNITNPYLYVLFNDLNITHMFYTSGSSNSWDLMTQYGLFRALLRYLNPTSGYSGSMQIRYLNSLIGNNFQDLFLTYNSHPLNPMPIQNVFGGSYVNGPFNGSLLGMWLFWKGMNIHTANTYFGANSSAPPVIGPGDTAEFTVEVPMPVFRYILQGKSNVSVYFGNMFNVTWWSGSNNQPPSGNPSNTPTPLYYQPVNPLVPSSLNAFPYNGSSIDYTNSPYNNEYLNPSSGNPTPPWQYIASYDFNMSRSPMASTAIYYDNYTFNATAAKGSGNTLNVSVQTNVISSNATGNYDMTLYGLKLGCVPRPGHNCILYATKPPAPNGTSISCFASPDNINDFSVFWTSQVASPNNFNYDIANFYPSSASQNVMITRWRGLLFMPYADEVALGFNNAGNIPTSTVSFNTQSPVYGSTTIGYNKNFILYLNNNSFTPSFNDFKSAYNFISASSLSLSPPYAVPQEAYGFNLLASSLEGEPSVLRIAGLRQVESVSQFSNINVNLFVITPPGGHCSLSATSSSSGVINFSSSSSLFSCGTSITTNKTWIALEDANTPFYVQMYNTSTLNLTNMSYGSTTLVSSNVSYYKSVQPTPSGSTITGYFANVSVSRDISKGVSFLFTPVPSSSTYANSDVYLYYTNGTPFNCNIQNNLFGGTLSAIRNNGVTALSSSGEYYLPNGTVYCKLSQPPVGLRAVFINGSGYLGSGDIQNDVAVLWPSAGSNLTIIYNGAPLISQNVNLSYQPGSSGPCNITKEIVQNGTFDLNGGLNEIPVPVSGGSCPKPFSLNPIDNYTLSFNTIFNGQLITRYVSIYQPSPGGIIALTTNTMPDNPQFIQNLSFVLPVGVTAPITFSIAKTGATCQNALMTAYSPYPYYEIPYQVASETAGTCGYTFMVNPNEYSSASGNYTFSILEATNIQPSYPTNWINVTTSRLSYAISTANYSFDLMANCKPFLGPCLSGFSAFGTNNIGQLLFNNVSANEGTLSVVSVGPVMACFNDAFQASEQVVWSSSGFGNVNYNSNKAYQITTPSQGVSSTFCVFNGAPIISDSITGTGQPLSFNVSDGLYKNVSSIEDSNSGSGTASAPFVNVGCSTYSSAIAQSCSVYNVSVNSQSLSGSCISTPNPSSGAPSVIVSSNITIPSSDVSGQFSHFICLSERSPIFDPNYSPTASENTNASGVGYGYFPANYTGGNVTADCALTEQVSSSNGQPAEFYVNGGLSPYSNSNPSEKYIADNTALTSSSISLPLLFGTSGSSGVLVDKCPINATISAMTLCTYSGSITPVSNSECQAQSPNYYFGGGCLVDSSYSCAPTKGWLNYSSSSGATTSLFTAAVTPSLITDNNNPNTVNSVSFSCSGTVILHNSTGAAQSFSASCSYGSSNGQCTATYANTGSLFNASCTAPSNPAAYPVPTNWVAVSSVSPSSMSINSVSVTTIQQENTGYQGGAGLCVNETNYIQQDQNAGWTFISPISKFSTPIAYLGNSYSVPDLGACEACRAVYNVTAANVSNITSGPSTTFTYSCSKGFGSILACANGSKVVMNAANTVNATLSYNNCPYVLQKPAVSCTNSTVTGSNSLKYGGSCASCNPTNLAGYSTATPATNCIAYRLPSAAYGTNASYVFQYDEQNGLGVGLGVLNESLRVSESLEGAKQQAKTRDAYFSALSVTQYEAQTIFTRIYPTNLLLSQFESEALFKSSLYPYDLLNTIMLQWPYFGISGMPGFINGSMPDYALDIFTGGSSQNCNSGHNPIFKIGEGMLCSGSYLTSLYPDGVYIPLGLLNAGLHGIELYSVSENGVSSIQPDINIYDSVGPAVKLSAACPNGARRAVTSTYHTGSGWNFNITYDEECNPINNVLYGYVINCMLQDYSNETYMPQAQYYLAYNLPTIWAISYSLLVSPKSYNIIPVQVNSINTQKGSSHLSLNYTASPKGYVYTTEYGNSGGKVSVIDGTTGSIITNITTGIGTSPIDPVASPDGSLVFVPDYGTAKIAVINTSSRSVINTIPISASFGPFGGPNQIDAITPDGKTLYVFGYTGVISVINVVSVASLRQTRQIPISHALAMYMDPSGNYLYVDYGNSTVSVIAIPSGVFLSPINLPGTQLTGMTMANGLLYIGDFSTGRLAVANPITGLWVRNITLTLSSASVYDVASSPDGNYVYACQIGANVNSEPLNVVTTSTGTVSSVFFQGKSCGAISVLPNQEYTYVATNGYGQLAAVSVSTGTVSTYSYVTKGTDLSITGMASLLSYK